jgi:hypothetical protein
MTSAGSSRPPGGWAWWLTFRVFYRLLRLLGAPIRTWWMAHGLGNVVELRTIGRRTGQPRTTMIGLLVVDGRWFLGHPSGHVAWTRNLAASSHAELSLSWPGFVPVRARLLSAGPERDRAIEATWQHPFPGNLVYRLARRYIRTAGVYFAVDLDTGDSASEALGASNPWKSA